VGFFYAEILKFPLIFACGKIKGRGGGETKLAVFLKPKFSYTSQLKKKTKFKKKKKEKRNLLDAG